MPRSLQRTAVSRGRAAVGRSDASSLLVATDGTRRLLGCLRLQPRGRHQRRDDRWTSLIVGVCRQGPWTGAARLFGGCVRGTGVAAGERPSDEPLLDRAQLGFGVERQHLVRAAATGQRRASPPDASRHRDPKRPRGSHPPTLISWDCRIKVVHLGGEPAPGDWWHADVEPSGSVGRPQCERDER